MKTALPQLQQRMRRKWHDALYYHPSIKRVNCTLTRREYQRLCRRAEAAGLPPTAYLKSAAFAYMAQRYLVPQHLEVALWRVSDDIRAIGNNLNQIARYANTYHDTPPTLLNDAYRLIEQMDTRITDFVRNPPLHGDQIA